MQTILAHKPKSFGTKAQGLSLRHGAPTWHLRTFGSPSDCGINVLQKTPLSPMDSVGFLFVQTAAIWFDSDAPATRRHNYHFAPMDRISSSVRWPGGLTCGSQTEKLLLEAGRTWDIAQADRSLLLQGIRRVPFMKRAALRSQGSLKISLPSNLALQLPRVKGPSCARFALVRSGKKIKPFYSSNESQ